MVADYLPYAYKTDPGFREMVRQEFLFDVVARAEKAKAQSRVRREEQQHGNEVQTR
jgi:hypothetical protein